MNIIKSYLPKIVIFIIIASFSFLFSCNQKSTKKKINLNTGWEFYYEKTNIWYPATVPGNIHTDLFANNLIDDPFYGDNANNLEWISKTTWKYRKSFDISSEFINRNLELVFEGLDTHADIYFNSKLIGKTDNMFRKWVFVIDKSLRKDKSNLIEVVFHPSSEYNQLKEDEGAYSIPDNHGNTRKSPYQFGWDWAPKLETCGIYKDVYINSWEKMRIKNLKIEQKLVSDTSAKLIAHIELESEKFYNASILISSPNNEFDSVSQKLDIYEACNYYKIEFEIKNPELWWSNGLGEQKIYDINVQVETKFRKEEAKAKIGLRNIEFISELDEFGQSFYFKLNNIPVFAKGANWVPAEYFSASNTEKNYKELLELAKDANFNMLRVWGGGLYENDEFYNICDSLGIMVWQDFMFACAMYPLNEEMEKNISEEIKYQANRLYNHPCVVLYCGNNEISNGWFDWGWQKQFNLTIEDSIKIWKDYDNLFHRIIPKALASVDKSRKYIPSSPFYGWGREQSLTHGDSHYWGVWWGMLDFKLFYQKVPRFMSEYGFQAFPNLESLKKFLPSDSLYLYSESLKSHQKHNFGFKAIRDYMEREYNVPNNFEDYVYISQLLQAEGVQEGVNAHLSEMPYCMGSLFWQFNDCWPSISWSAIDYYKKPKALYYYVKRDFENHSLIVFDKENLLKVFVVNHLPKTFNAYLIINLKNFKGDIINSDTSFNIISMLSSNEIKFEHNIEVNKITDTCFVEVIVKNFDGNNVVCSKSFISNYKTTKLPKADIIYKINKSGSCWEINLNSNVFIKSLQISSKAEGHFSDNWFDLIPNENKKVYFYPSDKIDKLELSFNSLNNVLNKKNK